MKVTVVGCGYVGLVTGVVLAHLGNDVICVDRDESKLAKIHNGHAPIFEPGLEELLRRSLENGFLTVCSSIQSATRQSDVVFIAVGTPPGNDGTPDISAVEAVAREIATAIESHKLIVNKSTVPVGTGDKIFQILASCGVPTDLFDVVSNPEFLREGSAIRDTLEPDRIVIGANRREAANVLLDLYSQLGRPTLVTDLCSAELIKYASNSFLAMKISFVNALSQICEECGADIGEVSRGMGSDSRIGTQFLQSGLGWGGSCFPKDVIGLLRTAESYGLDFGILNETIKINDSQTTRLLARVERRLKTLHGKTIALLGLAFKPNTDDIRDAKSIEIIRTILERGGKIRGFDPVAGPSIKALYPAIELARSAYEVADGADALILVTEWDEFRGLDLARLGARMRRRILFDGRRLYDRTSAVRAGFEYFAIGQSDTKESSSAAPD